MRLSRQWFIWNWKGAVLGALFRGTLFLAVNIGAGPEAAFIAMGTQAVFRLTIGGLVSGVIERLSAVTPHWLGTALAFTLVPLLVHTSELLVHSATGTPKLALAELVSLGVTFISTAFQLFAMRRGALIAGAGGKTLAEDLGALPRLAMEFVSGILRGAVLPIFRPRVVAR
jgi:hypothetical protein